MHEVGGKKDMTGFYRNLLTKNVAFGSTEEEAEAASDGGKAAWLKAQRLQEEAQAMEGRSGAAGFQRTFRESEIMYAGPARSDPGR